jgi:hypothetical protein
MSDAKVTHNASQGCHDFLRSYPGSTQAYDFYITTFYRTAEFGIAAAMMLGVAPLEKIIPFLELRLFIRYTHGLWESLFPVMMPYSASPPPRVVLPTSHSPRRNP